MPQRIQCNMGLGIGFKPTVSPKRGHVPDKDKFADVGSFGKDKRKFCCISSLLIIFSLMF